MARSAADVRRLAASAPSMIEADARVSVCRACPRLVAWREEIAVVKKRAYAGQEYWGRPVPGFGSAQPRILIVGLAPSAHGANRTGRNFTGDLSGDWLYAALHRAGLANQPTSVAADDGLELSDTSVIAAVRCAPPANLPTPEERDTCRPWLVRQLTLAWPTVHSVVALGAIGWKSFWLAIREAGLATIERFPAFGHGVRVELPGDRIAIGCYHVSPQNTQTGRLTETMLDAIFATARDHASMA